jgi:PAS domain S-box-containing protein
VAGRVIRSNAKQSASVPTRSSRLPAAHSSIRGQQKFTGQLEEKDGFKWIHNALARAQEALETLQETEELHRLLFEKVPHPRFVCDAGTQRILVVNDAAVRCYGYSRDEFLRMKVTGLSTPENRADFGRFCRKLSLSSPVANQQAGVFQHRKKDGRLIDMEVDGAVILVRGKRMFLLLTQDVTAKRRAEQLVRAHQATARALTESSTLAEASPKIFHAICENLGCDWGELWRVDPSAQVLRCMQVWHPKGTPQPEIERLARNTIQVRGEGIPGMVWARNKPVWIADVGQYPGLKRAPTFVRHGLRAAYGFPIRLNKEVLGVIAVFSHEIQPLDKHLLHLLKDICRQVGQAMGRRRAERQLLEISEREQQRIGQDLHDGLCQQLAGIAYIASSLENNLANTSRADATIAARIAELSRTTAVQARQIARGLNPVKLGTTGLMAALTELVSSIQSMFCISCRFECRHRILVSDHETAVHLYRIAQEAIHNSVTHGKATEILVSLRRKPGGTVLSVSDNGCGFSWGGAESYGMGLENMNYRARAIGAQLEFPPRDRGGTVMLCTLPHANGRLQ